MSCLIHRLSAWIISFVILAFPSSTVSSQDWSQREYGIGIAGPSISQDGPPGSSTLSAILYESPTDQSRIVGEFQDDSLVIPATGERHSIHAVLLEYAYEQLGLPILAYNADSTWVRVSLNCWDPTNERTAWLSVDSPGLEIRSWTEILSENDAFFFLNADGISFYSEPNTTALIDIRLTDKYGKPDYHMNRLRIVGGWMEVQVESPSANCISEEEVFEELGVRPKRYTAWIRFLDQHFRPLIFYSTRGC